MNSVSAAIADALLTGEPPAKIKAARRVARKWRLGRLSADFSALMPDRPARPRDLVLLAPNQMPRRGRGGSARNNIALWNSLAHIEFVAIDLALDMAGRFGGQMGEEFTSDFLAVAADEAMHFALIDRKLRSLGSHYGALPAHDSLWEAAFETRGDVMARLAIVPMVLEARGLDVTPAMRDRVMAQGDSTGGKILQRILDDEIRHVRIGTKHFRSACQGIGKSPENYWKILLSRHFRGTLKPLFNDSARLAAGLPRTFYAGVAS